MFMDWVWHMVANSWNNGNRAGATAPGAAGEWGWHEFFPRNPSAGGRVVLPQRCRGVRGRAGPGPRVEYGLFIHRAKPFVSSIPWLCRKVVPREARRRAQPESDGGGEKECMDGWVVGMMVCSVQQFKQQQYGL